jgi:dTDP-4-dehydrorhamnose reductase
MKKVLITGSNGLLGQKLTERILAKKDFELIATAKGRSRYTETEGYTYTEMDITDQDSINQVKDLFHSDVVIHTAAMINVDTCEIEKENYWKFNVDSVGYFLKRLLESKLIFFYGLALVPLPLNELVIFYKYFRYACE